MVGFGAAGSADNKPCGSADAVLGQLHRAVAESSRKTSRILLSTSLSLHHNIHRPQVSSAPAAAAAGPLPIKIYSYSFSQGLYPLAVPAAYHPILAVPAASAIPAASFFASLFAVPTASPNAPSFQPAYDILRAPPFFVRRPKSLDCLVRYNSMGQ